MWLRYKFWKNIGDAQQCHVVTGQNANNKYLFFKRDEGLCDVRIKRDIEALLDPPGDGRSKFEIAYEKYGISFDEKGSEVNGSSATSSDSETIQPKKASVKPKKKKLGRPKKKS